MYLTVFVLVSGRVQRREATGEMEKQRRPLWRQEEEARCAY